MKLGKKLKPLATQATETELVPLKKGKSIENALFDVEDDVQNNLVRMTNYIYPFVLNQLVKLNFPIIRIIFIGCRARTRKGVC